MLHLVDTLHLCIALAPVALYLLAVGGVNLATRPLVVSGAKDTAALGLAVSGFVIVGPLELFLPTATAFRLGPYVWLLLVGFYLLSLTLVILLRRPRIVIYNMGPQQLRPILAGVVTELDRDARWAGDCLYLPSQGIQFHIEAVSFARNIQLIATGHAQSFEGWLRLTRALRTALRQQPGPRNVYGLGLVIMGLLLVAAMTFWTVQDADTLAQSLKQMLHLRD